MHMREKKGEERRLSKKQCVIRMVDHGRVKVFKKEGEKALFQKKGNKTDTTQLKETYNLSKTRDPRKSVQSRRFSGGGGLM